MFKHKGSVFLILQPDNTGVAGGLQQSLKIKLHYTGTERCSLILFGSWSCNPTFKKIAESHCAFDGNWSLRVQVQTMQEAVSAQFLSILSASQEFHLIMTDAGFNSTFFAMD